MNMIQNKSNPEAFYFLWKQPIRYNVVEIENQYFLKTLYNIPDLYDFLANIHNTYFYGIAPPFAKGGVGDRRTNTVRIPPNL